MLASYPNFSIITVCLNAASTLAETLTSVAKQQKVDIEHIVIDGASTDNTAEIIAQYGTHVTQYVSEPDKGIYDAMNKGLRLATGEIIGFLNADDTYVDELVLARVLVAMQENKVDALFGDTEFLNPKTRCVVRRYSSKNFHPNRIGWGWMPAHPTLFLRSYLYKEFGGFKTDYKIAGDFEFVARIFRNERLNYVYLSEVLVRMYTQGISTTGWRSTILLNKEVLRACYENGIYTNTLMVLSKYPRKILEFLRL